MLWRADQTGQSSVPASAGEWPDDSNGESELARPLLLHGHIFKNAGSTLDWALARSLGDGFMACPDERAMREHPEVYLQQLAGTHSGLCALSSHVMPLDVSLPAGIRPLRVYLLRHPILRISSVYAFERRQQASTPGAEAAKAMAFGDYVAWRMQPEVRPVIRDYQTRYLSGLHTAAAEAPLQLADMQRALHTVDVLAWVGAVEYFDQSMVLLEHYLRPCFPGIDLAYVPQNVGAAPETGLLPDSASPAELLASLGPVADAVLDNNRCDLGLHAMAVAQLRARCAACPDFDTRLLDFRARCLRLQEGS